jgi:hypothetical protein
VVLLFEKLQSSKIFIVSKLQIKVEAAEQRNFNKYSKAEYLVYFGDLVFLWLF